MKKIKLSGREQAVLRAIDYAVGSKGVDIQKTTHIEPGELVDILNGLCAAGYVEVTPPVEKIEFREYAEQHYEVNPSYAADLREAMRRA